MRTNAEFGILANVYSNRQTVIWGSSEPCNGRSQSVS